MTKRRAPQSVCAALKRIAGRIGWAEAGRIVGRAERTIRDWSDPDCATSITIDAALRLDAAWAASGGRGLPLSDTVARLASAIRCSLRHDRDALGTAIAAAAHETGQAVAASVLAIGGEAGPAQLVTALAEAEEGMSALARLTAKLRKRLTLSGAAAWTVRHS